MALLNKNAKTEETVNETAAETPKVETKVETKEVAVKQEAGAVTAASFWMMNDAVQSVIDTATYGDFTSVIASQGTFQEAGQGGKDLGKWIKFKPIQAKVKLVCAPGSQDDEAREYFAAVYEGEVTLEGKTIEECVEDAKAAGYDKASVKEYIDLYAYVVEHESGDSLVDEVAVLQLSPMSKIAWKQFSKKLELRAAFGQLKVDGELIVKATATADSNKAGQKFTKYAFELV